MILTYLAVALIVIYAIIIVLVSVGPPSRLAAVTGWSCALLAEITILLNLLKSNV